VLAGLWFFAGVVTDDFRASMGLTALWFAVAGLATLVVGWTRRELRLPVIGTYVVTVALVGGFLGCTTLRDKTVTSKS
jgi:hypothetical protein